ncbi:hypothetical protein GCM10023093_15630 [Nemorincola caseinilytica]|uniref:Lipocalin-like domain-containing protein n=1 Tax=Nemorincola caseinilytica TaxID=2054315 RepID=A0ABP8NBZ3_9BACT
MKNLRYLPLIIMAALLLGSCNKDDEHKKAVQTLCSRLWSSHTVTDNGLPSLVDCMYADELTFNTNGGGNRHYRLKCDPDDPENVPLQWSLSPDARTLSVSNFEGDQKKTTQMKVFSLSRTTLEVEYTNEEGHVIHTVYNGM